MVLRRPGQILLISCYELGHQPLHIASAAAFLERAGYTPDTLDISVESFDVERVVRARVVGISVPMHTALRLGVRVAERVRRTNPTCHICFYGLYASLNAEYLLERVADSVIGGECETPLLGLIQALEEGQPSQVEGVGRPGRLADPFLKRLPFRVPSRGSLPALAKYARLERDGVRELAGYVEASRGCLHMCLHCPIPTVYGGRFFVVPKEIVLEDIRRLVRAGATHITFGDPDFLNGPRHSLAIERQDPLRQAERQDRARQGPGSRYDGHPEGRHRALQAVHGQRVLQALVDGYGVRDNLRANLSLAPLSGCLGTNKSGLLGQKDPCSSRVRSTNKRPNRWNWLGRRVPLPRCCAGPHARSR